MKVNDFRRREEINFVQLISPWYRHGEHWFRVFRTTCNTSVINITFSIMSTDWYCILTCWQIQCILLQLDWLFYSFCWCVFFCFVFPHRVLLVSLCTDIIWTLCVWLYVCMYVCLVISGVYLSVYVICRCIFILFIIRRPLFDLMPILLFSFSFFFFCFFFPLLTSNIVVLFSSLAQQSVTLSIRYNTCWLSFHC